MNLRRFLMCALCIMSSFAAPTILLGFSGTSIVATKGRAAHVPIGWPDGVRQLVNDPMRTSGWNSWFSEWPNDVNQYAFEVKSTDDLNRLIEKLASVKSEIRQIRLSHLKEPSGLGWTHCLPEGNNIPVIFSMGDQSRIDEWYKTMRKPFGVIEFTAAPIAVPPTLTIFVQNEIVNIHDLKIPDGIEVTGGYVPTVFHRFNTADEEEEKQDTNSKEIVNATRSQAEETLDADSQTAANAIKDFLKRRNGKAKE